MASAVNETLFPVFELMLLVCVYLWV